MTLLWLPRNTGTWVEGFPVLRKLCLYATLGACVCVCERGGKGVACVHACAHILRRRRQCASWPYA